ncbi:MAG TPA: cupin domain-containing protein [Crenalkalicoccus sp.]|nr:cupin domain-containing protein [Crenalkalicoccus sp.]
MDAVSLERRLLILAPLLASLADPDAVASPLDRRETFVLLPDQIRFEPPGHLPAGSGEMARLYGDIDKPGPYLVMMKWNPGWFSAPHSYRTDRIQVVVSGSWWVNSGADFDPRQAVPVPAGGFVLRHARTWHYDGVPQDGGEPAVIAIFGIGPVDIQLADPAAPSWRQV